MQGFKGFILRGNLVELAVAFIMATSFAAVVTAFTNLLLSIVSNFGGQPNFDKVEVGEVVVGPFLTALVAFLILAAVVYFFVVVPYTKAKTKFFPDEAGGPSDVELLSEIRDLLAGRTV